MPLNWFLRNCLLWDRTWLILLLKAWKEGCKVEPCVPARGLWAHSLSWQHYFSHRTELPGLPGQSGCGAWDPSGRELNMITAFRERNSAGLRHEWKLARATCVPSPGRRVQLWGPPRVVYKMEGVEVLAVLWCDTAPAQVKGCFQRLVQVDASQSETAPAAITPSELEASCGSPVSASALPWGWIST